MRILQRRRSQRGAGPGAHELRRRYPPLRSAWWGAGFALVGTETFEILVLMLTTVAYGAVLSVGALGFALRIAPMLLAPVVTAALDRRPERRAGFARMTVLARAAGIGLFGAVLFLPGAPHWALYVLVGAVAALDATYLAATRASMPRILRDAEEPGALGRANAMLVIQWNSVQILVPPLVIWVLQIADVPVTLGVAVCMLLVAFAVLGPYHRSYPADPPAAAGTAAGSFWQRFTSGFRSIKADPIARAVVVAGAAGQGAIFTFSVTVPQVVGSTAGPHAVGFTLSALAVGSILGARFASRFEKAPSQFTALAATTAVLGGCLAVVAASVHVAVVISAALVMGACAGVATVVRTTLLQRRFTDAALGGVLVSAMVLGQVLMPFLPQIWDLLADRAAVAWAYASLVGVQLAALIAITAGLRPGGATRRALRPPQEGADQ
jgi:hypothetical protein